MSLLTKIYRWIVFLLAAAYCLRMLFFADWDGFAGPFRYFTIWALFLSFFAASRMVALTEGRSVRRWDGFVSMTAVINAMVVLLFWRLYFADPLSVTSNGQLSEPHLELYLHALGPLLQWIDAVFIHRSFRDVKVGMTWLLGVIVAYISWAELVVAPLNDSPVGVVTSGLPYPFLNNLPFDARMNFYISNVAVGILLLGGGTVLAWGVRHLRPAPAAL